MDIKNLFFTITGRVSRKTYWLSYLGLIGVFGLAIAGLASIPAHVPSAKIAVIAAMALLAIVYFWAAIAIQVKRWHDRDKSGWWALIGLVPYIGGLWVFIECGCLPGTDGPNQYGADSLRANQ